MRVANQSKRAFILSLMLHLLVLFILLSSFSFSSSTPFVVKNEDNKIINAIALNDTNLMAPPTKKIEEPPVKNEVKPDLPEKTIEQKLAEEIKKHAMQIVDKDKASAAPAQDKTIIPLDKKKTKVTAKKITKKDWSKQLLADLESEMIKQKKLKQKFVKKNFNRELKRQSSKALEELIKTQKSVTGISAHRQGIIDKYKAQILDAIGQQWVVPSHVDKRLTCELLIHLGPGGVVKDVQIIKSSSDPALDHSAKIAVYKASPLPVPTDVYSFEPFKQFYLKVKPENMIEGGGSNDFL